MNLDYFTRSVTKTKRVTAQDVINEYAKKGDNATTAITNMVYKIKRITAEVE